MTTSTEVIRQGDLYTNRLGHRQVADCDGLLCRFGCEVLIVPEARLAGALGQLGYRVKRRRKGDEKAESDGRPEASGNTDRT